MAKDKKELKKKIVRLETQLQKKNAELKKQCVTCRSCVSMCDDCKKMLKENLANE